MVDHPSPHPCLPERAQMPNSEVDLSPGTLVPMAQSAPLAPLLPWVALLWVAHLKVALLWVAHLKVALLGLPYPFHFHLSLVLLLLVEELLALVWIQLVCTLPPLAVDTQTRMSSTLWMWARARACVCVCARACACVCARACACVHVYRHVSASTHVHTYTHRKTVLQGQKHMYTPYNSMKGQQRTLLSSQYIKLHPEFLDNPKPCPTYSESQNFRNHLISQIMSQDGRCKFS